MRSAELHVNGIRVSPMLLAERYGQRLRGMLGRKPLPPALLIAPCSSVHTWWMGVSIDVALVDAERRVLAVRTMSPWGYFGGRGTKTVLEAPADSFGQWELDVGATVSWTVNGHE